MVEVLVDTSVWIDYFLGKSEARVLERLLQLDMVLGHEWVIGELMVGQRSLAQDAFIKRVQMLTMLPVYHLVDVHQFVRKHALAGEGLSFVDVQLLFGCCIKGVELWTFDRKLKKAAIKLDCSFDVRQFALK